MTALAETTTETSTNKTLDQVLTFTLGTELYGLDILRVQEIKGWETPTPIPNVPSYVKGVVNLRGVVVPIIDLRERFEIAEPTYDDSTVVIIVRTMLQQKNERVIGIVVDSVSDVYTINMGTIQPAPKDQTHKNGHNMDQEFVSGLITLGEEMMILLNIDTLVQDGFLNHLN
ncbi:MAG: chemotaxis protein CheW [Proteobacteria bacterium]|nr:chemotaxis protein CheW [Pseudomonadota bacterium]